MKTSPTDPNTTQGLNKVRKITINVIKYYHNKKMRKKILRHIHMYINMHTNSCVSNTNTASSLHTASASKCIAL